MNDDDSSTALASPPPSRFNQTKLKLLAITSLIFITIFFLSSFEPSFSGFLPRTRNNAKLFQNGDNSIPVNDSSIIAPKVPALVDRNASRTKPTGRHVCTCLPSYSSTAANPSATDNRASPEAIKWLHIPKTGTSFISTLWASACSFPNKYIDLNIDSMYCRNEEGFSYGMYDFVLMARYPWAIYCAPQWSDRNDGSDDEPVQEAPNAEAKLKPVLTLMDGTQHVPVHPPFGMDHTTPFLQKKKLQFQQGNRSWPSFVDLDVPIAAFFRQPEERIVSAFYDGRHSNGIGKRWSELAETTQPLYVDMEGKCTHPGSHHLADVMNTETARNATQVTNALECFARFPGIAGCTARMLTGETCADPGQNKGLDGKGGEYGKDGTQNVQEALTMLTRYIKFVGLTEEWNESICQFHKLFRTRAEQFLVDANSNKQKSPDTTGFSGTRLSYDLPLQAQFMNVHKGSHKMLTIEHLNGFEDKADRAVYDVAKKIFEDMVGDERCYKFIPYENEEDRTMTEHSSKASHKTCIPKTCAELKKQCGEWDDECGSTIICGMCNPGKTGLPDTWRTRCEDGLCMDYCPPWVEKGVWYASDFEQKRNDSSLVFFANKLQAEKRPFLSPLNAIRTCNGACIQMTKMKNNGTLFPSPNLAETFVESGLCSCGTSPPSRFAGGKLNEDDFKAIHDMTANCRDGKNRAKNARLDPTETQPRCCPHLPRKSERLPDGWTPFEPLTDTVYFMHEPLECGGHDFCRNLALKHNADLAVLDAFSKMCHLGRGKINLGGAFYIAKGLSEMHYFDVSKWKSKRQSNKQRT